jgi:aryl sulfotransferase
MAILWALLAIAGVLIAFIVVQSLYLGAVLKWEDKQSVGLGYYGRTPKEREKFKATLRLHAWLASPLLRLNAAIAKVDFRKITFSYQGVAGPHGSCSEESFVKGAACPAQADDVFVVTQMKCGTTWMQQIVYEVLNRGAGDLVESGKTMYALSPWLEGRKSVSLEAAPRLGTERPSRIIKTHFPAQLCPAAKQARYIYVARHPVSCFASCIDFIVTNVGGMAPPVEAFEAWYCSPDLMWWGTWPEHVKGWWDRSERDGNVLFLYFEEMKRDLPGTVRRVAEFLGVRPLNEQELARVVEKAGFAYMQKHQDNFEMHPPHILQTNAELFVSGKTDRHKDVPVEIRERLLAWAAGEMAGHAFPLAQAYPDVSAAAGQPVPRP